MHNIAWNKYYIQPVYKFEVYYLIKVAIKQSIHDRVGDNRAHG
jgi:hypothetical protein